MCVQRERLSKFLLSIQSIQCVCNCNLKIEQRDFRERDLGVVLKCVYIYCVNCCVFVLRERERERERFFEKNM